MSLLLGLALQLSAQEYTIRTALGKAGAPTKANSYFSGYQSIGEFGVIGLLVAQGAFLRQGFIQPGIAGKAKAEKTNEALHCSVYPNPFSFEVFIQTQRPGEGIEILIHDPIGRVAYVGSFRPLPTIRLELPFLKAGMYILNVRSGTKTFRSPLIKS
ncbi:T9SS type A sorting domain-containing protein [Fulvivirgaceae bacterium BMA12]|uniref:T9SS type A sorting domain-containing protein n=1 Tax=Agaribacillus aureus TaxID=3051825 RepID=A0ABT8L5U6_9BACT|nr:T9SS type A sorting domain-containing protein [Fulvivirgaceae bacterium BMA12]